MPLVDELAIFSRQLGDDEIACLYSWQQNDSLTIQTLCGL